MKLPVVYIAVMELDARRERSARTCLDTRRVNPGGIKVVVASTRQMARARSKPRFETTIQPCFCPAASRARCPKL
jgi:hypothetical protein